MPLLVVDTNVVISAVIARSYSLNLIFNPQLILVSPEFIHLELEEHLQEIGEKAGLQGTEIKAVFDSIFRRISVFDKGEYGRFKEQALNVTPDKDDWPFFALALKEGCGIWSNDQRLKSQKSVRVLNTAELAAIIP